MTDPRITKEMIEAGAEALYERQYSLAISAGNAPRWGAPDIPHSRDDYREQSLAALEATMQERDTLRAQIPPCDGGCNYNSGPEETCSAHGRPVAEVWEIVQQIGIERDRYRAAIEDVMELVGGSKARRILGAALGGGDHE